MVFFTESYVQKYSEQLYLWQSNTGNNPNVHQEENGSHLGTFIQWNATQWKEEKAGNKENY